MILQHGEREASAAVWASRLSVFSAAVLLCAIPLHRLLGLPTPIALNLFTIAFAGALLAMCLGIVALVIVWQRGGAGIGQAILAIVVGLAMFAWPALYLPALTTLPAINDVTTDTRSPPPFQELAKARNAQMNSADYPGDDFARQQMASYPDLRPFMLDRSAQEAFELALDALNRLKIPVTSEQAPRPGQPGYIEAVDRTLVMGFYDDLVLRIDGDGRSARIDVRSASRYGTHDIGRNAERVRRVLRELQMRLEANVPTTPADRLARARALRDKAAVPKRLKGGSREKAGSRPGQDRAPPDARRAPALTGKQL